MPSRETRKKKEQLLALERRMREHFARTYPDSHLWFFRDDSDGEPSKKAAGYLGTEPVMFVGQRPSTGKGGTSKPAVGGFYSLLIEYGFKDAHITDLIKEQMKVGKPSAEQVDRNWPFFHEELKIVEPKVVVALGGWVRSVLEQRIEYLVPIEEIMHYSYRYIKRPEKAQRMRDDLRRIRRKIEATPSTCCRKGEFRAD